MATSDDRRTATWAVGSNRYAKRTELPTDAAAGSTPSPLVQPDVRAAQLELTGVTWDLDKIDLELIRPRPTENALVRFRAALPELIWNAAALEGNTITLPEVRTLLDGVTVAGKRIDETKQVLALAEAYNLMVDMVASGEFRLDKSTSDRLHGIVAQHEAIEAGAFRGEGTANGGGAVLLSSGGVVDGTPQSELPERWASLMDYLGDAAMSDPRLRALVYNAAVTRSQFYFDGNKRTARLMMAGELMANGYDSVHVPYARLLEFNLALDELFSTDDATTLMAFTADCAPRN
jgi:Fic family protein